MYIFFLRIYCQFKNHSEPGNPKELLLSLFHGDKALGDKQFWRNMVRVPPSLKYISSSGSSESSNISRCSWCFKKSYSNFGFFLSSLYFQDFLETRAFTVSHDMCMQILNFSFWIMRRGGMLSFRRDHT